MSAFLRRRFLLSILPFLCVIPLVGAAPKWLKLQTKDLVVYSDASAKDIVEFAVGFTAYRQVFHEVFPVTQMPPPATVLLYRDLSTLQKHLPESKSENSETVSYSAEVDGEELLAAAVDGDRAKVLEQTIEFETVWGLRRCGYFVPVWMSQGAGEVLSTLDVRKDRCLIGDAPEGHERRWLDEFRLPWKRFFEISTDSPEYSGRRADGTYHAQAWALMHWVLLGHSRETFDALALKLRDTDGLAAVEAAMGVPADRFNGEIRGHLRSDSLHRELPFDSQALRSQLKPTAAPEPEVHVVVSNLLFAVNRPAAAELELAQATVLAAGSAVVKEARARRAMQAGDSDEAVRLYREAIELGSSNAMAYLRSAEQRLNDMVGSRLGQPGGGGSGVESSLAEIRRALALDAGSTQGYILLGRALYLTPTLTDDDFREISRGVSRGETGETVRYYRAMLYERLKRFDEAAADFRQIVADPLTQKNLRDIVASHLIDAELNRVTAAANALVKDKEFVAARTLVTKAIDEATDAALKTELGNLRKWIDERLAWNDVRMAYEAKHWAEALASAKQFLTDFPESRAADSARHVIERSTHELESAPHS